MRTTGRFKKPANTDDMSDLRSWLDGPRVPPILPDVEPVPRVVERPGLWQRLRRFFRL